MSVLDDIWRWLTMYHVRHGCDPALIHVSVADVRSIAEAMRSYMSITETPPVTRIYGVPVVVEPSFPPGLWIAVHPREVLRATR